jgi:predicted Zn-dependent protease
LRERLLKECVQCAMPRSHGVEWIDLKNARFCRTCHAAVPTRDTLKAQSGGGPVPSSKVH